METVADIERDFKRAALSPEDYQPITEKYPFQFSYSRQENRVIPALSSYSFRSMKSLNCTVEVNGNKYDIPVRLKHIAQQIEDAKVILEYKDDWDDEGAMATDINTFEKAVNFVVQYSVFVFNNYTTILKEPYIDILRDGSISVHWDAAKNTQLLIVFKKDKDELAYFYAEQGDRKIPFKSAIVPGDPVNETLAIWMRSYLH